jgi:hypothetical protein
MTFIANSIDQSLVEKLAVAQLVKKFPVFMDTEYLLPCSQEPATGTYPEADKSIPHAHNLFLFR